jgi:hypothetical protein
MVKKEGEKKALTGKRTTNDWAMRNLLRYERKEGLIDDAESEREYKQFQEKEEQEDSGEIRNMFISGAKRLVSSGTFQGYVGAADIYEKIGEEKKAIAVLKLAAQKYERMGNEDSAHPGNYSNAAQFRQHAGEIYASLGLVKEAQRERATGKMLEDKIPSGWFPGGALAIAGLLCGAFFFSTKITGNVVGVSTQTSSLIGVGLLIVGLVSGFFWIKNRK